MTLSNTGHIDYLCERSYQSLSLKKMGNQGYQKPINATAIFDKLFEITGYKNNQEFQEHNEQNSYEAFRKAVAIIRTRHTLIWYKKLELSKAEDLYIVDRFQTYLEKKVEGH